jgi:hypothetical protein
MSGSCRDMSRAREKILLFPFFFYFFHQKTLSKAHNYARALLSQRTLSSSQRNYSDGDKTKNVRTCRAASIKRIGWRFF